jgi:hypothetical protein
MGKWKLDPFPELLLIHLFRFSMVQHCPWGRVKGFHFVPGDHYNDQQNDESCRSLT